MVTAGITPKMAVVRQANNQEASVKVSTPDRPNVLSTRQPSRIEEMVMLTLVHWMNQRMD